MAAKSGGGPRRPPQSKWGHKVTRTITGPRTGIKVSPSSYLADMKLTTEEKLELTCEMYPPKIIELLDITTTSHHKESALSVDQALFQPFPSEVLFQQFESHQVYEFPLKFRNLDTVARHIKVTGEESPYFKVVCQRPAAGNKVAPGMEITYNIVFTPDEKKDYDHELVCITEREKFVVPVKAIGTRALLDFPDEITFNSAPVKYPSTKTVLMRNVGNAEAKFTLETEKPYSVTPSTGTLAVNSCQQATITFTPQQVGEHSGELVLHYSTGEKVYIKLYGSSNDVNIRLDRTSVTLDDTYISLSSQRSVLLHNRSDVVVKFQWKAFAFPVDEQLQKQIVLDDLKKEEKLTQEGFYQTCVHNPSIRDRLPILNRTLTLNRKKYTDDEQFLYFDDCVTIDPLEGEIWPNSQAEISVIFRPDAATTFSRVAYCDVTGREARLPLKIKGDGMGPKCIFSFDTLDIQNVFVGSAHAYEVCLVNQGDIEAPFTFVPSTSLFGPNFTFAPSQGTIQPGKLQAIQISFCSQELGDFNEDFEWVLTGAPDPLILKIKGTVIGPTFQFDTPQVNFGVVSCGFLATKEISLSNTSEIPMTFCFRVPDSSRKGSKGTGASSSSASVSSDSDAEFVIVPQSGTLPPNFQQVVKLMFTPSCVKTYSNMLVMALQETGGDVYSLPVLADAIVPKVTLLTPLLDYGRCFLEYPYTMNAELLNDSSLPVKYEVPRQKDKTVIIYSTPHPSGIIQPHTTLQLPLELSPQIQGAISMNVPIRIIHAGDDPMFVGVTCVGEGPVVFVSPSKLSWGVCPVLTPISKVVMVANQSVIPAKFKCALAQEKSVFIVEPSSATVPPEGSLELTITAHVDDCLKFVDKLNIIIDRGVNFTVHLRAQGKGSTILSEPPLCPRVDLGVFYSKGLCRKEFKLTNMGRRTQGLSWVTEGFSVTKIKKVEAERRSRDVQDIKFKHEPQNRVAMPPKKPLFRIIPEKFELDPLQTVVVTLQGYSKDTREVEERMICHSIIGKNPLKERIMTVDIVAHFINPLLSFSAEQVNFEVSQPPGSKLVYHTEQLGMHNVSELPLTAVFLCPYPFCLMDGEMAYAQRELTLGPGETAELTILYDSTYCRNKHSCVEEKVMTVSYKEHPQTNSIMLRSEVHFPNLTFNTREVDFGCILNDTEVMRVGTMTNNSPLPVKYSWFFIRRPPIVREDPDLWDEGVDMESEYGSDEFVYIEEMIGDEEEREGCKEEEEDAEALRSSSEKDLASSGSSGVDAGELCDIEGEDTSDLRPHTPEVLEKEEGASRSRSPSLARSRTPSDRVVRKSRSPSERVPSVSNKISRSRSPSERRPSPQPSVSSRQPSLSNKLSDRQPSISSKQPSWRPSPTDGTEHAHNVRVNIDSGTSANLDSGTNLCSEGIQSSAGNISKEEEGEGRGERRGSNKQKADRPKRVKRSVPSPVLSPQPKIICKKRRKYKQAWKKATDFFKPIPISQVFDILPVHGELAPGESSPIFYSFYGHSDTKADVIAACKVEGGPAYEVQLRGQASKMHYCFSNKALEFGAVLHDQIHSTEIVLFNKGKVTFDFTTLGVKESADEIIPGEIIVSPAQGRIVANDSVTFTVTFLPGVPEVFRKKFEIEVAHFEPDVITLSGEAVYPTLALDLPRDTRNVPQSIQKEARVNVGVTGVKEAGAEGEGAPEEGEAIGEEMQRLDAEVDRLLVKEFVTKNIDKLFTKPKPRVNLPEFYLDFGYVVYGSTISTKSITLVNNGHTPISFHVPRSALEGSGFRVDMMEKVRSLPPDETLDLDVTFDPTLIMMEEGKALTTLNFNLVGGPQYSLRLSADVTRPTVEMSSSRLDFGRVLCGQCKIITVRFSNTHKVECEWSAFTEKKPKPIPPHVPQHLRKKMRQKPPPRYFEVDPPSGLLPPGETQDIRIRFMPSEETEYKEIIPFKIKRHPESELELDLIGYGSEPQLDFDKTLVEFESVLPFSSGSVAEVTITNPTSHPVELYSLDYDKQYALEEEILSQLSEFYDSQGRLLLPPFEPGRILPPKVHEAYTKEKETKLRFADNNSLIPSETDNMADSYFSVDQDSDFKLPSTDGRVGLTEHPYCTSCSRITDDTGIPIPQDVDLRNAPLAMAVIESLANHIGIDLSPEAREAEGRRGVAIVLHGASCSGRTTQARALGEVYGAPVLQLDSIVIEAISNAETSAGRRARELCMQALAPKSMEGSEITQHIGTTSGKKQQPVIKEHADPLTPQVPPVPFSVEPHDDKEYAVHTGMLYSTHLPEDLMVEILASRLQQEDCCKGLIFDGIDSQFTTGHLTSAAVILRAINNRKHIYFVHLSIDLQVIKERLEEIEQTKLAQLKEEEERRTEADKLELLSHEKLLNMDEDEYEALTEEKRKEVDSVCLLHKKIKREQRRRAKEEKDRQERERKEEEIRLKELEKTKKRGKKGGQMHKAGQPLKVQPPGTATIGISRPDSVASGINPQTSQALGGFIATASGVSVMSSTDSPNAATATPKHKGTRRRGSAKTLTQTDSEDDISKMERVFYGHYRQGLEGVKVLLEDWDREKGVARPKKVVEPEEQKPTPTRRSKGLKQKDIDIAMAAAPEVEENREGLGVPLINVNASESIANITAQILDSDLPTPDEILIDLGMGPDGPPIPGSFLFQVCPFPLKRRSHEEMSDVYSFIASSPEDPNAPPRDSVKTSSEADQEQTAPDKKDKVTSSSKASKRTSTMRPETSESIRKGQRKKGGASRAAVPSPQVVPSALSVMPEDQQEPSKDENEIIKLVKFRWIIPPGAETKLKLLFKSNEVGQYDLTLNFELTGTRRRYQLFCRGLCTVPTICNEPRIVFPNRKRNMAKDEIVHKRFVLSDNTYHFGPLHCGKTRDRYKEGRYPENMESLTISNTSMMLAEATFFFHRDYTGNTYLLDPPTMKLEPGQSKTLSIWAYPKSANKFEDILLCCLKHNPDPIAFKLCCYGAEPDLKVDKKVLEFKKVILRRKQTSILHLHNKTMLPVAWKLSGWEQLGEEFTFSQEHGIVQPLTDFPLSINFRSEKPVNITKKAFKIEVSDVEQVMGLMHVETVQISAEAYDVAIDISFPKGADGGLDFGCVKACDEQKMVLQIKNKGRYDIAYNFLFDESVAPEGVKVSRIFHIQPLSSALYPTDKPQSVAITFRSEKEVEIKSLAIIKCQVVDIHLGEQGEVVAEIPICVSARSVFSHYSICPIDSVNIVSMVINNRKQSNFVIQNKGDFEFKYSINKQMSVEQQRVRTVNLAAAAAKNRVKSRERVGSPKPTRLHSKKPEGPFRTEVLSGTQRLVLGMFTINPAFGSVLPGQSQTILVDCAADKAGKCEEALSIEISDRQKNSEPIKYRICGEVMIPGICTTDFSSIFEEHRVCRELGVLGQHLFQGEDCVGVYGEEEKRFVFRNVIVGKVARARFKISNPNKIQCDVLVSAKAITTGRTKGVSDSAFDVEPNTKVSIMPHSSVYATVIFRPMAIQSYSACFEAVPDSAKGRPLTFDLYGEGNLPQVSVIRPMLRNSKGHCCMLFQRLSLTHHQIQTLTLKNTGSIPAAVVLEVMEGESVFDVQPPCLNDSESGEEGEESSSPGYNRPIILNLDVGETCDCLVTFNPKAVKKFKGELWVSIKDNMFERFPVYMIGEGYEDDISIDSIRGCAEEETPGEIEEIPDDVEATRGTEINFGTLAVGENRQVSFRLANLSETSTMKFQWPAVPPLVFAPSTGHIKPKMSKTITVTFKTAKPHALKDQQVLGKIWKISFLKPLSRVPDWDDRMKSVQWVTVNPPPAPSTTGGLENASNNSILASSSSTSKPHNSPMKKKVVETEKEPTHQVLEDTYRDLELIVSGIADFCKYECPIVDIKFKDTLMFQTRVYTFPLRNPGKIALNYQWALLNQAPSRPTSRMDDTRDSISMISGEEKESPPLPFTVSPVSGSVLPEKEAEITIRFSPISVIDSRCLLHCHIPHLDNALSHLALPVEGKSLMPLCHFELEESDYLCERGGGGGAGHLDEGNQELASAKVLEFAPCSIGHLTQRKFDIINPTTSNYDFTWSTDSNSLAKPFSCVYQQGMVEAGKKYQMVFEYRPNSLEVLECLWNFSIPSLGLTQPFLLVGNTLDPSIFFDRTYLSFKTLLLGSSAKEVVYLVNTEETDYSFSFLSQSLHSESHTGQLTVKPMTGTIPPKSRTAVEILFTPHYEKDYSFQLKCKVKCKATPLILKVTAEGYSINLGLTYTSPEGSEVKLPVGRSDKRKIDFGQVQVHDSAIGQISVFNNSLYSCEFRWVISHLSRQVGMVSVEPSTGEVVTGNHVASQLMFKPGKMMTLRNCQLTLYIANGPTLPITLLGSAVEPSVSFSFEEHDFGPCLLHRTDMPAYKQTLIITNTESREMSVHCLSKSSPHLSFNFESRLLAKGDSARAILEFRPREPIKYSESVIFEINGFFRKVITVKGEGSPMRIELANPSQKIIKFGALRLNDKDVAYSTRTVRLVNRSPATLSPSVSIVPSSSIPALQEEGVLTVEPSGEIPLKANGGTCDITIAFNPTCRIPQFTEEVTLECQGTTQPLLAVTGSCHGLEVVLDSEYVPFGAVVLDSSSLRKILMINSGDIGAKFRWNTKDFGRHFSIAPTEGYISPGMQVTLDITFHPQELSQDLRVDKLHCNVEGAKTPLTLALCGACIEKTPFKEVLNFTATVRSKEVRNLSIHNKTHSPWLLYPVIDGEHWTGPDTLSIEANQTRHYELTYHPHTMTSETQKHHGSIFFPQPDGTGLLYHLQGTSEAPKVVEAIVQEIPCKTAHTRSLAVENWLRRPQRFTVTIEPLRPEKLDRSISLHGLNYIDVPALSRKDFQLHFYSFKECTILCRVMFKNKQTGEYLFYHVTFKSTAPGIMKTLSLTSQVRKSVSDHIYITNPLHNPVTMSVTCNVPDIALPSSFIIGAHSEGKCTFEYLPLKVGQNMGKITLQSSDLGTYLYELHLTATPCPQEKPVHFTTSLGTAQQHSCRFMNLSRTRTEYSCRVNSSDFNVDRNITVAANTEGSLDVTFEPSHLGDTQATLTIFSNTGGEYIIPLVGHCLHPKPQGPFVIKPGHSINIPFKNIFPQLMQFRFSVDNPAFMVKSSESIKQGKTSNISVSFDGKQGDSGVVKVGKLTVTSLASAKGKAKTQSDVSWVFYLKGALQSEPTPKH